MLYLHTKTKSIVETRGSTKCPHSLPVTELEMAPVPKSSEPFSSSKNVDGCEKGCLLRRDTYASDQSSASTDTLYQKQRCSERASASTVWLVFSETLTSQRKLLHWKNYSSFEGLGTTFRSQRRKLRVQREVCEVTKNKTKQQKT